jgi:hypothetical protein
MVRRRLAAPPDSQAFVESPIRDSRRDIEDLLAERGIAVSYEAIRLSDSIASGRASNIYWKGDWEVATALTDYGWSAEFKIPFAILNYSANSTEFGVNFLRYHNRTQELSVWADVTPQHKPEEMGQLSSLELPDHRAEKKWTLKPYLFAGVNVPDEQGEIQDSSYTGGLDILYEPTPSFAALFTLNPDFSQVEAQVTDIDFDYNEKYLRDPRTFFQEGSAYFGDEEYLYTNRIPDFDYGIKSFGRIGGMQIGFLGTEAADDRRDLALRILRELSDTDSFGLTVVSTEREEFTNLLTVVEIDGRRKSGLNYEIDYATSVTDLPNLLSDEKGDVIDASISWRWDHWSIGSDYSRYGVDYLPANGLIKQDLIGTEGVRPFVTYDRDFGDKAIRELNLYVTGSDRETLDGFLQTRSWSTGATVETRQQIRFGLFHYSGDYRPVAGEPGDFADFVHDDEFWTASLDFNTRSDVLGYGAAHSHGSIAGGDYDNTLVYLWYRPIDRLVLNISSEKLRSFGTFNQSIMTVGWDINSQSGIAARYIWTDDADFARLAYRRQVRSGLDIFLVFDDGPAYDPEISLKVVWAW